MGLGRFFRRTNWDRERFEEIESYVEIETDENIARGMPVGEARAAARRKLGNSTRIREEIYRMNTIAYLDTLSRDVHYSLRTLRRTPGFAAVALLTIAIGIGANTAVFSVINSVLLRPLHYPQAEELVAIRQVAPGAAGLASFSDGLRLSPSMYFTYSEQNRSFQSLGVWTTGTANVTGLAEPEQVRTVSVSDGVLQALGVPPFAGRWLLRADQTPVGQETVLLSYGYWQRRFGGDRSAIGRRIIVDSRPREIAGVMPQGFQVVQAEADLIMPLGFDRAKLIACANVTNLLLVKAESRQQELAVRTSLGAGWVRIVRVLLLESLLLGLMGGVLGIGIALAGLRLLVAIGPANLPRLGEISMDARTLGFTVLLSLLSGLFFGLIPALKYAGPGISAVLRSGGRTQSVSRERHRARNLLVVAQVALALVLMVSAGLMIRTFQALRAVEPGFTDAAHLQTMRISIPKSLVARPEQVIRIQNNIVDKLAATPGVTSAAFASAVPMEGFDSGWNEIFAGDKVYPAGQIAPLRLFKYVSPGFFHTAGTRIVAGRDLIWTEVYGQRPVAMVSENLARELWGTPSAAVGKRIREFPPMPWREVIGVIEDVRENGVHEKAPGIVYWPSMMDNIFGPSPLDVVRTMTFVVRSDRTGTEGFLNQVRQAVWSVNSSLPLASVRTMQEVYGQSLARTSFTLVMLGIAGAMALVLGVIGIYGVISYTVSQRRREIGIRLALGAQQGELRTMFVQHALVLAGIGVAIGLGAALGLTQLMKSLLFGISPMDPPTYAVVPVLLMASAALAAYLPARQAASVDPTEALRAE
jgi:cell division protein FtsX